MSENRLPNYERYTNLNSVQFFDALFHLVDIGKERAIPAIVEEAEDGTNLVTVRPLVLTTYDTKEGSKTEARQSCKVPVVQFCQGCFSLYTPLFRGDTGYLICGDRNATTAMEKNSATLTEEQGTEYGDNEGPQEADDYSLMSFANGFFLPCSWHTPTCKKTDGLVFKNTTADGDVLTLTVKDGEVTFKAEHLSIYPECDFYDDCHFHTSVDIENDLDVGNDASIGNNATVGNILTVKKDVDIGEEDHAHLKEMQFVVGCDNDNSYLLTWKGKVIATDGGSGTPIPFTGGGGGTGTNYFQFKMTLTTDSSGNVTASIGKGIVNLGGISVLFEGDSDIEIDTSATQIICVKCNASLGQSESVSIEIFDDYDSLRTAQSDYDYLYFPIYELVSGVLTVDYRVSIDAGVWES